MCSLSLEFLELTGYQINRSVIFKKIWEKCVTIRKKWILTFWWSQSDYFSTELLGENAGGQGAALGFQMFGGPVVTVLASKTSRKLIVWVFIPQTSF